MSLPEEFVVLWTVRLAVFVYFVRLYCDLASVSGSSPWVRTIWTLGCVANVSHIVAAMSLYHDMSHQHAVAHTAAQTKRVTGIDWGGGVYVNYVFAVIWCLDVAIWWRNGIQWPLQHRNYLIALHVVFSFIVINATAVFGPAFWLFLTPPVYLGALGVFWFKRSVAA